MDNKNFTIGVLSIVASVLFIGHMLPTPQASASTSIKDRDYQLVTARDTKGGEALYVFDNRTGQVGVFAWDGITKRIKPVTIENVPDMFK